MEQQVIADLLSTLIEGQVELAKMSIARRASLRATLWVVARSEFYEITIPLPNPDPVESAIRLVRAIKPDVFSFIGEAWSAPSVSDKLKAGTYRHGDIQAAPDRIEAVWLSAKGRRGMGINRTWTIDRMQRTINETTPGSGGKHVSRLDITW